MAIIDFLKWFSDLIPKWLEHKDKKQEKVELNQKKFFDAYIEPSFREISVIHKDYIDSFYELLKVYRGHTIGDEKLIDFLIEKKSKNQHLRDSFTIYLKGDLVNSVLFQKIIKKETFEDLSEKVIIEVQEYITLLSDYFNSPIENISWYTDFLEIVKSRIRIHSHSDIPKPERIMINSIAGADFESQINSTINQIISKYKEICSKYASLKGWFFV